MPNRTEHHTQVESCAACPQCGGEPRAAGANKCRCTECGHVYAKDEQLAARGWK